MTSVRRNKRRNSVIIDSRISDKSTKMVDYNLLSKYVVKGAF